MLRPLRSFLAFLGIVALSANCGGGDGTGPGTPQPSAIAPVSGNNQAGPAGQPLTQPLVVRVTASTGAAVAGVSVAWAVTAGGGSVPSTSTTNAQGQASVTWTLGPPAGVQTASASVVGLTGSPVSFTATASPNGTISGTITLVSTFLPAQAKRASPDVTAVVPPFNGKQPPGRGSSPGWRGKALGRSRVEYTPDELIVTFRASALGAPAIGSALLAAPATAQAVGSAIRARLASHAARGDMQIAGVSPVILAARVRVSDPARLEEVAAKLRRDGLVAVVERNPIVRLEGYSASVARSPDRLPNDPIYPWQAWHYGMIGLPKAWDITTGSASVLVAVIDDGIRFDHPGIAANLTADGYDFVANSFSVPFCGGGSTGQSADGDGYDSDPTNPADYDIDPGLGCITGLRTSGNHGLHVAGTIGAVGNDGMGVTGVNWTVRIRPVRVLGVGGGTDYDIAQGLLYAAGLPADNGAGGTVQPSAGAKVINMSLGGPGSTAVQQNAVVAASNAGSLIIAAAGNDAVSTPSYPAAYDQVVSVSAVGPDAVLASYSNFGSTIDIAAPGGDLADGGGDPSFGVMSTAWDYSTGTPIYDNSVWVGTSMASPHVAGVAALLLAQSPGLTAAQLRSRLVDYAVDVGASGRDDFYGAGIVNARNSLAQSFAPPGQTYARLYNATTGAILQTVPAQPSGSYTFAALADGAYHVFAGQDENGDQLIGLPGRRWGAFGGQTTPMTVTVAGAGTYPASFSIGLPDELEPNNAFANADALTVGGYRYGFISAPIGSASPDADVSRVLIPQAGQYTFETSPAIGACGFALEEDTELGLYDGGGSLVASNDDINAGALNFCSRVTATLTPGTYYLGVFGYYARRYRVQARSGS